MGRQYIEPMDARPLAPSMPTWLERVLQRCPGQCAICRSWTTAGLCPHCLARWTHSAPRCRTCAIQLPAETTDGSSAQQCGLCLRKPPPLDRCVAALDYAYPWDLLIQGFKFHQTLDLVGLLLERLDCALDVEEVSAPDWLLPVPLSTQRLRERGFNQCWELARRLAARRQLRCSAAMLLRVRDTPHQLALPAEQRAANVRQAFLIDPRQTHHLRGRHVAVLDDVMTTGATIHELALTLRRAGALSVQAWVLARTPDPRH